MEWDRAHRAQMRALLVSPEGIPPGDTLAHHVAKNLIDAGYAVQSRKGLIYPTNKGKRAWREGRIL